MQQRILASVVLSLALVLGSAGIASAATTITSSALDRMVIFPNDRPTLVKIGTDLQFVATGSTADGRVLQGISFRWSTGGNIGRINDAGIFTGERGGIGTVTARSGGTSATVGVVVKGSASDIAKQKPKPTVLGTTTSETAQQPITQQETPQETTSNENVNAEAPAAGETTQQETTASACSPWPALAWIGILVAYAVLLVVYYLMLGDTASPWWWVPPAALTVLVLLLYAGARCGTGQTWIPVVHVLVGAGISFLYYQLLRPKGSTIYMPPRQQ